MPKQDESGVAISLDDARRISVGQHDDPFAVLGPHKVGRGRYVTAFDPGAAKLSAVVDGKRHPLAPVDGVQGMFSGKVPGTKPYSLHGEDGFGGSWDFDDAYRFGPVIGEMDEYLLSEGTHERIWQVLGAHVIEHEGVQGTHFAVWAPNARRVSVVGDFNQWDGRRHAMRRRGATGVWEIFVPGVGEGTVYKYEILGVDGRTGPQKADPVGFGSQHPPDNGSVVRDITGYGWDDDDWMTSRGARNSREAPISVYEVHPGSWKRRHDEGGRPLSYKEMAEDLVDYAIDMGFTHLELLPVSEFPFDGSWGYQPVGLFAPTIRFGPPHEFRDLIDAAHQKGLGVILDWVPGHFPTDAHGLGRFDGTALYEHADPREGFHQDWNTYIFNYGRREVCNYLISNALYWLEEYHIDGLRVDAVASMLYRDYSRKDGEWVPNKDGGRENYEAIGMLQGMNVTTYGKCPGIMTVAEESTSFPGVSQPVDSGGLGFGFKWNMGWMNDTLEYMKEDPVHRRHHHARMTFGLHYAFSENFVLPLSHDEVVHGKGSLLGRMPGDRRQRFGDKAGDRLTEGGVFGEDHDAFKPHLGLQNIGAEIDVERRQRLVRGDVHEIGGHPLRVFDNHVDDADIAGPGVQCRDLVFLHARQPAERDVVDGAGDDEVHLRRLGEIFIGLHALGHVFGRVGGDEGNLLPIKAAGGVQLLNSDLGAAEGGEAGVGGHRADEADLHLGAGGARDERGGGEDAGEFQTIEHGCASLSVTVPGPWALLCILYTVTGAAESQPLFRFTRLSRPPASSTPLVRPRATLRASSRPLVAAPRWSAAGCAGEYLKKAMRRRRPSVIAFSKYSRAKRVPEGPRMRD